MDLCMDLPLQNLSISGIAIESVRESPHAFYFALNYMQNFPVKLL